MWQVFAAETSSQCQEQPSRVKPLGCFVGEPTEMKVIIGHKGKHGVRATSLVVVLRWE